jgi:chromosome segregation ATPase
LVAPVPNAQPSRQVIRRGRISVEVPTLAAARERVEHSVGALGAQVARATVEERDRAEYVIRVTPERLDALMDSIGTLGHVESRSVGAEEVTEQVIDVEARLGALRASRDRLRQLFERANTTQDVIAVERELARVQAEIESLEARLATLRGQVALSELSVALRERPVLGPLGYVAMGIGNGVRKLFIWR